jgi:hypothetical protein
MNFYSLYIEVNPCDVSKIIFSFFYSKNALFSYLSEIVTDGRIRGRIKENWSF